jgi:hypothetical protein
MQKLKGISSGQNNKSCRIIHPESKKICLAFFLFFCDFLLNLQESANLFNYWSYLFAIRTLERFWLLQCCPWGGRPARAAGIRRGRRGFWLRKGRRRVLGSLGAGLGRCLASGDGRRAARRWPVAAAAASLDAARQGLNCELAALE